MEGSGGKQWVRSVGTLFATVVGVGIFGLPYVFHQAGFLIGFLELLILAVVMVMISMMYAALTIETPGKHRYTAYIKRYLGKVGGELAMVIVFVSVLGAGLAFTIIGGEFLSSLIPALEPALASVIVLLIAALLARGGLSVVSRVVVLIVCVLLALYAVVIGSAAPAFQFENLSASVVSLPTLALPYGVILFALTGIGAIPEMHDLLGRRARRLMGAIVAAYLLIFALYALFALFVVGAAGAGTSTDAISGLTPYVASWITTIGAILGVVSVISIFTVIGMENANALTIDFKFSPRLAHLVTFGVPLVFFLLGARQFISVVGFVGGLFNGAMGILVILAYERLKKTTTKKPYIRIPRVCSFLVFLALLFGMIVQMVYTK